jgi:hypothetical protein
VAGALVILQGLLCGLGIAGDQVGIAALVAVSLVAVTLGVLAIMVLDSARWRPAELAVGPRQPANQAAVAPDLQTVHVESSL